jgi:hypothetical protein
MNSAHHAKLTKKTVKTVLSNAESVNMDNRRNNENGKAISTVRFRFTQPGMVSSNNMSANVMAPQPSMK